VEQRGQNQTHILILNDPFAARMTDASGYQIHALNALGPANSILGGRHSIVDQPTTIIAALLAPSSSTSRFTAARTSRVLL
jgi:hypothetical protein